MSRLLAHCLIPVASRKATASFQLLRDLQPGSRPLQLQPYGVGCWSQDPAYYEPFLSHAVRMEKEGVQRIRLYCAARPAHAIRLLVDGGRLGQCLGRRHDRVVETLTWVHSQGQFLRFAYDQPAVTLREATPFYDRDGKQVSAPLYHPAQGLFHHDKPVTGALVVEYQPEYFLYEVHYGTGEEVVTELAFRSIQLAWLMGNIEDALLPEVRVIALSGQQAAQLSFKRTYWPRSSSAAAQFVSAESLAANDQAQMVYLETARETSTERIYSSQNPDSYIEFQQTHSVTFSPQPGSGPATGGGNGQARSMVMRFARRQSTG
ncbi:MAG: hypothetical protein HQM06_00185 [Magnetococcales bacterium]|nr:hypothetical protein [Magnetococcales bacterium]